MALSSPVCDWQMSKNSLVERLQFVLDTSQWSDFSFCVGTSNMQVFKAHRMILAACSPVFEAMCFGPLAEKQCVNVPDLDPQVFKNMLEYMYTDHLHLKSIDEACGMLYASKKYMMPHLSTLCREYVVNNIRPGNVLSVFEFAENVQENELFHPCIQIMCKHTEEVLQKPMIHMSSLTLTTLLEQDSLNVSELELFQTVVSWAEEECEHRGLQLTAENCRLVLVESGILPKIRFLTLDIEEFSKYPEQSGILSPEEVHILRLAICELNGICDENLPLTSEGSLQNFHDSDVIMLNEESVNRDSCIFMNSIKETLNTYKLCCIGKPRNRILVKQFCCGRRFLKTTHSVRGRVRLLTKVQVDRSIIVRGVRFFTRLVPQSEFTLFRPYRQNYKENLEICILDQRDTLLCKTSFTENVTYNTIATVMLSEPVRFTSSREYRIICVLPTGAAGYTYEYPLSFLSQAEVTQNVEIRFSDYADMGDNGQFLPRLDMGFVDGITFSF